MIPTYRTILVACDLGESASPVFRHALNLARSQDGRIHFVHVMPALGSQAITYVENLIGKERFGAFEIAHEREAVELLRAEMDQFIQRELKACTENWCRIADFEVHRGDPVAQILASADRLHADIIVMGGGGKSRLKHVLLGSVAEQVLATSHRPVLIVPLVPEQFCLKGETVSAPAADDEKQQ